MISSQIEFIFHQKLFWTILDQNSCIGPWNIKSIIENFTFVLEVKMFTTAFIKSKHRLSDTLKQDHNPVLILPCNKARDKYK